MIHKLALAAAWYALYCLVVFGLGLLWFDYKLWKMRRGQWLI